LQNIISVETNVKDFLKAVSEATDADKLRQDLFDNKKMSQALDACLDVNEASMLSEIVFQRLSDLHKAKEWDEFKSRPHADWKRVRGAIEHENNIINNRLTWLFTSQLILFGGYFSLIQKSIEEGIDIHDKAFNQSLTILPFIGIGVSAVILVGIDAAIKQIHALDVWWSKIGMNAGAIEDKQGRIAYQHPSINGNFNGALYRILNIRWVPFLMIIAWIKISSDLWPEIWNIAQISSLSPGFLIALTVLSLFLWLQFRANLSMKR
jgi:hypothetical protein